MSSTRWYITILVVRSWAGDTLTGDPLIDLQYRIIRAENSEAAYARALELGHAAGQSDRNAKGQLITWECVGLHDLRELPDGDLSDGVEVYSRIVRSDPNSHVVPKEQLTVFWDKATQDKAAQELLDGT